ncbi:MAG: dTDP-4-dehydrorhamnose reductase [Rhodospirillaceae bacterium]|nr:dTDP-4-dehydrorhamnose reductase [Rhodospirillaceae bacterium]
MKILLLGVRGQVGWELHRALSPLGDVVACGRKEADLSNLDGLRTVAAVANADVIVNAAAYTAVDKAETEGAQAERINHEAVAVLAAHAKRSGSILVHYSTDYVFDGTKASPYVETDATRPINFYGSTKLRGEEAIQSSGCRHLIFRTSWVYAARGGNFVRTMLRLAATRDELNVVSDQVGAPTAAELIADVTALALYRGLDGGLYHLTAAGETSWHGFAQLVIGEAQILGRALKAGPGQVKAIPTAAYPTPAKRPANSRMSTDKLRTALGITLPPWQHHARRVVAELAAESK